MIAADRPVQRPPDARLLVVNACGNIIDVPRSRLVELLRPGDLVIANDAATLPASLPGVHLRTGAEIEVRLAGQASLASDGEGVAGRTRSAPAERSAFRAVVFGAGDFHTRTEDRPLPPPLAPGDRLSFGDALSATVEGLFDHPRLILLRFEGSPGAVWAGLARRGRPIQYAHVPAPLRLWDVWTPIAAQPVAFEPPSASFAIDWHSIRAMRQRRIAFATITLAAGISSTGDPDLDRRLPFDEPYRIPHATASAIRKTRAQGGRIIAVGTTVVRGLEHAGARDGVVHAGDGVANQRIGPTSRLAIVNAILSGTHERGSSHYLMLRAFMNDDTLTEADAALDALGYRTHEFGDSVLVERREGMVRESSCPRGSYYVGAIRRLTASTPTNSTTIRASTARLTRRRVRPSATQTSSSR
jgi:S-adenosylmethionine:tRNA ribosyltransferase-isomerase